MQLVSFNVFRTLGFPDTTVLKAEHFQRHKELLKEADWVLFPEYWQLNALVHGLKCRVFPSVASYRIGHDKIEMTRAFQTVAPEHTPWTLIEANGPQEREALWNAMPLPFVAKLPKSSMGDGVWLIESREDWQRYCDRTDVLYVQEYLPIDRDARVVVVGDRVVAAYWRTQAEQGFYNNVAKGGQVDTREVPAVVTDLVLRLARTLDVNHAGFDIAVVEGYPYVLEFNRLFGNKGLAKGSDLNEAILDYLKAQHSAENPEGPTEPPPLWPVAV
ncbi:ATP-grasp domain-containing protein [Marinobacter sp. SBS5]|uniref:ATP-grasp domain-containing protein n=1 Tax=Marinobacter sp. SBS5 TaxID=3401754 RepID=UPI003AB06334